MGDAMGVGSVKAAAIVAASVIAISLLGLALRQVIQGFDSTIEPQPVSTAPADPQDPALVLGNYNPAFPPRNGRILDISKNPSFEGLQATPVTVDIRQLDTPS